VSNITDDEETLVEEVGYGIIRQLQRGMVLSVWSLVASLLLQNPMGITVEELVESVLWLKRHANNVGAYIDWPGRIPKSYQTAPYPLLLHSVV